MLTKPDSCLLFPITTIIIEESSVELLVQRKGVLQESDTFIPTPVIVANFDTVQGMDDME